MGTGENSKLENLGSFYFFLLNHTLNHLVFVSVQFLSFLNLELQLIELFKVKHGLASEVFENIFGINSNSHICAQNLIANQY